MIPSMIFTLYAASLAFAMAVRAEELQRYRYSKYMRNKVKRKFWTFGAWVTAIAIFALLINNVVEGLL